MVLRIQRFCAPKTLTREFSRSLSTVSLNSRAATRPDSGTEAVLGESRPEELLSSKVEKPRLNTTKRTLSNSPLSQLYEAGHQLKRSESTFDILEQCGKKAIHKYNDESLYLQFKWDVAITVIPHLWLRDNCRCAHCVNQDTMQRSFDTFSLPAKLVPSEVIIEENGIKITWANDGHITFHDWDFLFKYSRHFMQSATEAEKDNLTANPHKFWGAEIKENPPSVHYDEIMASDKGVGKWTNKIREYGFCYVDGCPVSPEKTKELIERISFIRQTHYGGFYDFTADLSMKDTAYTNLALPPHTDTAYFTDPAGLQMFHLLSHEDGQGGESLLVDGFKAAGILEVESRRFFNDLTKIPVTWHASGNEGVTIIPARKFPIFTMEDLREGLIPRLLQIRWNNDDRGTIPLYEDRNMGAVKWYPAAAHFNEILKRKEMQYWAQLKPGRPLIFDNWRVLHGRSEFTGKRRMCGSYLNHDDFISRWRNTNFTREEIMRQIF